MKQKIPTGVGTIIIIIFAVTVGMFVWRYEKNQSVINQSQQTVQGGKPETQSPIVNQQSQNQQEVTQPIMPSLKNENSKSPEQLVKDFYEWYIGNINYRYYLVNNLHPDKDPVNLNTLIQKSPFVSSAYERNMKKRIGMYDAILCTNDNEFNTVKEYGKAQINGNGAKVDILRGYVSNNSTTKIRIMLKNENNQWKLDDIICNF